MKRFRTLTLAIALILAAGMPAAAAQGHGRPALMSSAPSAVAAPDQHVGQPVDVPTGETGIATVHCPDGEVPSGGGAVGIGHIIFISDFAITNSFPQSDGWVVTGLNTSARTESLSAFVTCSTAPHAVVEAEGGFLNPGQSGFSTASCPAGQVPTGGGLHSTGTEVTLGSSAARNNGWSVQFTNNSGAVQTPQAVVICSTTPHSVNTSPGKDVAPGKGGSDSVACPAGQVVTGGGAATNSAGAFISYLAGGSARWSVQVINRTSSTVHLAAQVICTAA